MATSYFPIYSWMAKVALYAAKEAPVKSVLTWAQSSSNPGTDDRPSLPDDDFSSDDPLSSSTFILCSVALSHCKKTWACETYISTQTGLLKG